MIRDQGMLLQGEPITQKKKKKDNWICLLPPLGFLWTIIEVVAHHYCLFLLFTVSKGLTGTPCVGCSHRDADVCVQ